MKFGEKLRTVRAARGLSQIELSKLARIDSRFISMMENDKILPSAEWEHRLREALGWDQNAEQALELLETDREPT